MSNNPWTAVSLFSGAGIGDLGLRAGGCEFILISELESDRIALARNNFPEAKIVEGDIWKEKDNIIATVRSKLGNNKQLDLLSCTAPCQGMSKNGQGTLLKNIREGKRPKLDPRNRLIIPALEIIKALRPRVCVFENVTEMKRTYIEDAAGKIKTILDVIRDTLGDAYVGNAYEVEFADYGIPQRRQRLISVFSRDKKIVAAATALVPLIPNPTHSKTPEPNKKPWVNVWDTIKDLPPLDASSSNTAACADVPFHRVPILDSMKYWWVSRTPPGKSAFDNQCDKCGFEGNLTHSTGRGTDGINRASRETPLFCERCGTMLPRPSTMEDGKHRIMSGYTSAYKRMAANLPAPALTRNFSYACSDQKVHPYQNRVLSIAEALRIHTLSDFPYDWKLLSPTGKVSVASDGLIRLVIGESIPPRFMMLLVKHLMQICSSSNSDSTAQVLAQVENFPRQVDLFTEI